MGYLRPIDRVEKYPNPVKDDLGYFGYWCLLIGFFCMALSTLYFYMRAQAVSGSKFFEVLTMGITGIATLAYLLMFTGAGRMWVEEVPGTFSPVYWGRYVDWVLTTPLMLWDILALAGAPADEIAQVLIMDMLMIGFGCAGAQTPDQNKWFFFIFGMVTFIHIVAVLLKYSKVNKYGEEARALYNKVAWMTKKSTFCFRLFCLPILNWIATIISPLHSNAFWGRAKNFFFSHLERLETQSDGRVATRTYFSRSHDFPSRETYIFITLWSGLFLFLLFSRKVL